MDVRMMADDHVDCKESASIGFNELALEEAGAVSDRVTRTAFDLRGEELLAALDGGKF
jgi:hypothetical protein